MNLVPNHLPEQPCLWTPCTLGPRPMSIHLLMLSSGAAMRLIHHMLVVMCHMHMLVCHPSGKQLLIGRELLIDKAAVNPVNKSTTKQDIWKYQMVLPHGPNILEIHIWETNMHWSIVYTKLLCQIVIAIYDHFIQHNSVGTKAPKHLHCMNCSEHHSPRHIATSLLTYSKTHFGKHLPDSASQSTLKVVWHLPSRGGRPWQVFHTFSLGRIQHLHKVVRTSRMISWMWLDFPQDGWCILGQSVPQKLWLPLNPEASYTPIPRMSWFLDTHTTTNDICWNRCPQSFWVGAQQWEAEQHPKSQICAYLLFLGSCVPSHHMPWIGNNPAINDPTPSSTTMK